MKIIDACGVVWRAHREPMPIFTMGSPRDRKFSRGKRWFGLTLYSNLAIDFDDEENCYSMYTDDKEIRLYDCEMMEVDYPPYEAAKNSLSYRFVGLEGVDDGTYTYTIKAQDVLMFDLPKTGSLFGDNMDMFEE